jgi:hypothetical protein
MRTDLQHAFATRRPDFWGHVLTSYQYPTCSDEITIQKPATVDLSRVRGLWHPDYPDLSWGELVGCAASKTRERLKRFDACLRELRDNPYYYLNVGRKEDWSFFEVDGDYYISSGNHRTVVARFFLELNGQPPLVHGVAVMSLSLTSWLDRQAATVDLFTDFDAEGDGGTAAVGVQA